MPKVSGNREQRSYAGLMEGSPADKLPADRAYDANKLLASAKRRNPDAAIPPMLSGLIRREYDAHAKERHLAEWFFLPS